MDQVTDVSSALQKAIYERLSGLISVPVFDSVPESTRYPYVTIGRELGSDRTPLNNRRRRHQRILYLTVWSDYPGQAEVKRINGEVDRALHGVRLALEVGRVVGLEVSNTDSTPDADGVTYQGSVTIKVITQS